MGETLIEGWRHSVGVGNLMDAWCVPHDEVKWGFLGHRVGPSVQGVLRQW